MVCPSFWGGSSGSWPGRSLHSSLWDKGVGHRCDGRDVCSPRLLAAVPGGLPGMPAPRLSLSGQGLHLPRKPGAPGSTGHPCQHHRAVSRERERLGAAALWLAFQTSCCLASQRSGLQGVTWETSCQLFAEHSPSSLLNYTLKLLSISLIVLTVRSLLRKDFAHCNAKCRLGLKQASLVLWQ